MSSPVEQQAQEILQAPLDLFRRTDGGVGYAKFRHTHLPKWIEDAANGDKDAAELVKVVERFSKLCDFMMRK